MRRTCKCFDSTRTRCMYLVPPVSDTVRVDAMQCWYLHGSSLLYRLQLIHANSTGHINYDNWWQLDEHVKSMHNACCYCLASIHIQGMPQKTVPFHHFGLFSLFFFNLILFCLCSLSISYTDARGKILHTSILLPGCTGTNRLNIQKIIIFHLCPVFNTQSSIANWRNIH